MSVSKSVVRVMFPETPGEVNAKSTAMIQYESQWPVKRVIEAARQKYGTVNTADDEWGMFVPADDPSQPGKWLNPESMMAEYSPQTLHYRKKFAQYKVSDVDGESRKIVMVTLDETLSIAAVTEIICKRYGVDAADFSIQKFQRSSGHHWLIVDQPLYTQMPRDQTIVLRKKLFVSDDTVTIDQPTLLHFLFLEARVSILAGVHSLSFDLAVHFAGLNMQITYSNYDPLVHVAGFLEVLHFLPAQYRATPFVEEYVYREHRRLKGVDQVTAKLGFVKRIMQLPTYGATFAPAKECTDEAASFSLGVNSNAVLCMHKQTKEVIGSNLLVEINSVDLSNTVLTLRLKGRDRAFNLENAADAVLLYDLILAYKRSQRTKRKQSALAVFAAGSFLTQRRQPSFAVRSNNPDSALAGINDVLQATNLC